MNQDWFQLKQSDMIQHFQTFAIQKMDAEFCNFRFMRKKGDFCHMGVRSQGGSESGLVFVESW